jgi:hypothetical protein
MSGAPTSAPTCIPKQKTQLPNISISPRPVLPVGLLLLLLLLLVLLLLLLLP